MTLAKLIDVGDQQRHRLAVAQRARDLFAQALLERAVRVQAGQRIAQRERVELVAHLRELLGRRRDLAAAIARAAPRARRSCSRSCVLTMRSSSTRRVVVALELERVDQLIDDLQQIGELPRLRDHVVEMARVDRGDQLFGLRKPGDDRAAACAGAASRRARAAPRRASPGMCRSASTAATSGCSREQARALLARSSASSTLQRARSTRPRAFKLLRSSSTQMTIGFPGSSAELA